MTTRTDKNGNTVVDGFLCDPSGEGRYLFREGLKDKNWRRFLTRQDAHYFGVWINDVTRQSANYCEGDTCITTCHSEESYQKELADLREFHSPPKPDTMLVTGDDGSTIKVEIPYDHDGLTSEGRELLSLAFAPGGEQ
jgi:hypothetical protein